MLNTDTNEQTEITNVIDLPAVARHFGVTTRTILRWVELGEFPEPFRCGRRFLRWQVPALNKWIAEKQEANGDS